MDYVENELTYEEYVSLRSSVGWKIFSKEQTKKCIDNSLYTITAKNNNQIVAMGRLIGDGMYYILVDIVVRPEYQNIGIGSKIIDVIIEYVKNETPIGGRASIQLISEKGKEEFYLKKGFKTIPHEYCGCGMRKVIMK